MNPTIRTHWDHDAEASVLGGVLLRESLLEKLGLEVPDFHHPRHQYVWQAMHGCRAQALPIDPVTVAAELKRTGKAGPFSGGGEDDSGALAFLGLLALRVTGEDSARHHAQIVKRHRVLRDLREAVGRIKDTIDSPDNVDDDALTGEAAVQWAIGELRAVRVEAIEDGTIDVPRLVRERLREYEAIAEAKLRGVPALIGYPTGVKALDEVIGGYLPGPPIVIAGRPGMGKSSLIRAATSACARKSIGTHTISLEDTRARFADRVIAEESGVAITTLRDGTLDRGQMSELRNAIGRLFTRSTWKVSDRSMTARDVVACWRRHGEANDTKLVAVDYLQKIRKRDARMSEYEHVSESMGVMADAAKDDGIALLVGSQLNRDCERRDDKRPQLADMRGGGPIEELAKLVLGVYRGAKYDSAPTDADDFPGTPEEWFTTMEILILKNNDGVDSCRVFARWDGPTTTVS